jgi:hypothetical protein
MIMNARLHKPWTAQPASAGWWGRLLAAVLFTVYFNYLPLHLFSAPHQHDAIASAHAMAPDDGQHHDASHHGHEDHHAPHPASEHSLQMRAKSESPLVLVALIATLAEGVCDTRDLHAPIRVIEQLWSPGESPPTAAQPRAPPAA